MPTDSKTVEIFTDGACSPNPGPGGYGVIIQRDGKRTELSGGFRNTTNNRMEILAAIKGLTALDTAGENGHNGYDVTIFSDSRYVVDMFTGEHAKRWRAQGWMRNRKDRALNPDLWAQLLDLSEKNRVGFKWVKSHNDHPQNERCDQLAVEARQKEDLPPDGGYEEAIRIETEQTEFDGLL
jgi:ribonuclease HI